MAYYLVTGGTGLIGHQFIQYLLDNQITAPENIIVLTRNKKKASSQFAECLIFVESFYEISDDIQVDYIVNLAGEPIADKRWSTEQKSKLWQSRVCLTQELSDWIKTRKQAPLAMVSGSAIGWYGNGGATVLDEYSQPHKEYTHELCNAWEEAALAAENDGVRVCIIRTGLVISKQGGFLSQLKLPFKFAMGTQLGDGDQFMSWVHLFDVVKVIVYLLNNKELNGVFNLTAPKPVTNREFTQTFAKQLNRPAFFKAPAWLLFFLLGERAELLVKGQKVVPKRLELSGFKFRYQTLKAALVDVLSN
ncbi:TIGR01777 family oxidoreductase [Aliikangiella sp. IMCC44359]|uniref:TIGR01777 family oxidoreductase n=1 Tax=Aliikangiella sp. IMCC44359 TaxID=3459125 RepID=UPI00403B0206